LANYLNIRAVLALVAIESLLRKARGQMEIGSRPRANLIELASDIVSAYVAHNTVPMSDLPRLIERVHATLQEIEGAPAAEPRQELKPAVPVRKSVTDDHIVCLEDGKKFKSLKRHLRTRYDMSPEEYREKWSLPAEYPMVAPNYARQRSDLARKMGLGLQKK
jgi:predicted transcriptional regulator